MIMQRTWAMPDADTFSIAPIRDFVRKHVSGRAVVVDPFARNEVAFATVTNDLNPETFAQHHMDAVDFLTMLADKGEQADAVIFDPPYSPRQIAECYKAAGLTVTMKDTQSARFKAECRTQIRRLLKVGGVVLSFGWNTVGHGEEFRLDEVLVVCHGGDHNDTLCIAETRVAQQMRLFNHERDA